MGFTPITKTKLAEQVAGAIRQAIVGGDFEPGDPLPSERELAGQFGVNRSSVREALLRLEAWGLVDIRQGGATRVRDVFVGAGLQLLPYLLAPADRVDVPLLLDVLAVRTMMLAGAAELAAAAPERAQAGERLGPAIAGMVAADTALAVLQHDFSYWEQMVALGGNRALQLLANVQREVYLQHAERMALLVPALPYDVTRHRAALAAIVAGDGAAAAAHMRAHGDEGLQRARALLLPRATAPARSPTAAPGDRDAAPSAVAPTPSPGGSRR